MGDKRMAVAVIELVTLAIALYAQDRNFRADTYRKAALASMWSAEKLGRLAMRAELAYRREVSP